MSSRKASAITSSNVPSHGDPDRKRVLNVLAQRRYRQRKRQRLAELESRAVGSSSSPTQLTNEILTAPTNLLTPSESSSDFSVINEAIIPSSSEETARTEPFAPFSFLDPGLSDSPNTLLAFSYDTSNNAFPNDIDIDLFLSESPSREEEREAPRLQNICRFSPTSSTLSNDQIMDMPVLKTLRIGISLAKILGCENTVFDPLHMRTLDFSELPDLSVIPQNLLPTEAQRLIPHHPFLDLLPWAPVRTRLIYIFSLPSEMRPPSARDSMGIVQLAYDLEDVSEGCRIHGANGLNPEDWEVGEAFFRNWWWALDSNVIENTNRLRALRGAKRLML